MTNREAINRIEDHIEVHSLAEPQADLIHVALRMAIEALKQPKIIRCHECKHNPKKEWFGCPMSHLNERQRPEDAWCWRGEEEDDAAD